MQRYNSFTMIHKALRAMLYDTALTLQQTCFTDEDESGIALEKVECVLYLFEKHAHHEDASILPAIELYEPGLVEEFEKEHVTDIAIGNRLKHLLNIFRDTNFDEGKLISGSAICKSFIEFMVFNLEHMAKEEVLLNQALWKHYTDEQIVLINQKLVDGIPAEEKALSAKWMVRGVNNVEAINWLKTIKNTSPAFVFESLLGLIETELPGERREKIEDGVFADVGAFAD